MSQNRLDPAAAPAAWPDAWKGEIGVLKLPLGMRLLRDETHELPIRNHLSQSCANLRQFVVPSHHGELLAETAQQTRRLRRQVPRVPAL